MNKRDKYLELILLQMSNFSELNFEDILDVDLDEDLGEIIPGIAVGVKILGEELDYKIKELKKRDEERELLLQEVHHRVKNNLQLLSSIFGFDLRREKSEIVKEKIVEMNARIHTIALVHELLYKSKDFVSVDCLQYCTNLCSSLSFIYGGGRNIVIEYDIDQNISFHINQARYIGLIINEVISNSYKHQFLNQNDGLIKVICKEIELNYVIEINDNGKNISSLHNKDTTGNALIKGFVLQLKGTSLVNTDNGYSFKFSFPKHKK